MMRLGDVIISFPPLILALLIVSALGSNSVILVSSVAFFYLPRVARVVRAAALRIVTEDFIGVAIVRGEPWTWIAFHEILPNIIGTLLVEFAVRTGYAVVFIGSMGFLGFGPPPPSPEWGLMINEAREYIAVAPWAAIGPSLAVATFVVALNVFTEGWARLKAPYVDAGR
jgi:peptide/nickel transport system permease protein